MQTKTLGIVLIIIGALMLIYGGFNYSTTERVADIGPIHINKERQHPVRWPPILGAILVVGGIAVLAMARKK